MLMRAVGRSMFDNNHPRDVGMAGGAGGEERKGDMTQRHAKPDPGLVARVSASIRYDHRQGARVVWTRRTHGAWCQRRTNQIEGRQWDFPAFVNNDANGYRQGRDDYVRAVARTERNLATFWIVIKDHSGISSKSWHGRSNRATKNKGSRFAL